MNISNSVVADETHSVSSSNTTPVSSEIKIESSGDNIKRINDILKGAVIGESYQSISEKAIAKSIEHINKVISNTSIELLYSIHKETNTVVIKMRNKETDIIVKEIPPEKVLDMFVSRMKLLGLFLDERI